MPSGNSTSLFPLCKTSFISFFCLTALIALLSIKTVSCNLAKKPNKGHLDTSDLAIKLILVREDSIEMSIQDAWFEINNPGLSL